MNIFGIGIATEDNSNFNDEDETVLVLNDKGELVPLEDEIDDYYQEEQ